MTQNLHKSEGKITPVGDKSGVVNLQWHITARCQFKCRHCYMVNSPTDENEIKNITI